MGHGSGLQVRRGNAGEAFESCIAVFARHYADLHETHFGGVYDGVLDAINAVRQRGIRNGTVTGQSRSSWDITLAQVELGEFDVVVGEDDVGNAKPDPDVLL